MSVYRVVLAPNREIYVLARSFAHAVIRTRVLYRRPEILLVSELGKAV